MIVLTTLLLFAVILGLMVVAIGGRKVVDKASFRNKNQEEVPPTIKVGENIGHINLKGKE